MRRVQPPCSCGNTVTCRYCRLRSIDPMLQKAWAQDNSSGEKNSKGVSNSTSSSNISKNTVDKPQLVTPVVTKEPIIILPQVSPVTSTPKPSTSSSLTDSLLNIKVNTRAHLQNQGNNKPVGSNGTPWIDADKEKITWAVGVTTVSSRLSTHLPSTLEHICRAGFDRPVIYVDSTTFHQCIELERMRGCDVHCRRGPGNAWANYHGALCDLLIRNPRANRIVIFQDDLECTTNIRQYLEKQSFPQRGYLNLYTATVNEDLVIAGALRPGWHETDQRGRGALALVFDRDSAEALISHDITGKRPRSVKNSWVQNIDGWVREVLVVNLKFKEYCHNPSLVQHTGKGSSTLGNPNYKESGLYPGKYFDCMSLLGKL